jgi:hypothetical protein
VPLFLATEYNTASDHMMSLSASLAGIIESVGQVGEEREQKQALEERMTWFHGMVR